MTCADNANALAAKGEPHGQHTAIDKTEAEVPLFFGTVAEVFRNDTVWIEKCVLCSLEPDAILAPVQQVLSAVPFKSRHSASYGKITIQKYGCHLSIGSAKVV